MEKKGEPNEKVTRDKKKLEGRGCDLFRSHEIEGKQNYSRRCVDKNPMAAGVEGRCKGQKKEEAPAPQKCHGEKKVHEGPRGKMGKGKVECTGAKGPLEKNELGYAPRGEKGTEE